MKRYLTYKDDKSNKFWQIEKKDTSLVITFGKIGSKGTTKEANYWDEKDCLKEAEKLIKEKLKKGYEEENDKKPDLTPKTTDQKIDPSVLEEGLYQRIRSLMMSPESTNLLMAIELLEENSKAFSLFETELFVAYQFNDDKKLKKEMDQMIQTHGSDLLRNALKERFAFKTAADQKIMQYISVLPKKFGLDPMKMAETIFSITGYFGAEYLLAHAKSETKVEVLKKLLKYYEKTNPAGTFRYEGDLPEELAQLASEIKHLQTHKLFNVIFKLTELESLDVAGSKQVKRIPAEIVSLPKLKVLRLNTCALKQFPAEVLVLKNLEELYLQNGDDKDSQSIAEIPSEINQLKQLRVLCIYNNPLKKLPDTITTLENLEKLDVDQTALTELPSNLGKLEKLQELRINNSWGSKENDNKFSSFPPQILHLINLKVLGIDPSLLDNIPDGFEKMTKLEKISTNCYFDDVIAKLQEKVKTVLPNCKVSKRW